MTNRNGQSRPPAGEAAPSVVLLVFRMDGREHALPVEDVVEVVRMVAATPLPEAPVWVGGVINFRGRVIPLIDARARLGAPRREPDLSTRIIVVQTSEWAAGLVVDEVVEVLPVRAEALDPPGKATAGAAAVSGVVSEGDRLILVLDRDRLLEGSVDLRLPFDLEQTREAER